MRSIIFIAAMTILAGCASHRIDYNRQSMNLSLGMSKTEVQTVMGSPRRTEVNELRERWIFWNPVMMGFTPVDNEHMAQDRLVVTFQEDKVVKWGNQTMADDIMEASQKSMETSYKLLLQSQPARK